MTTLLAEEDQKTFDGMWNNMLTPVNRVDRQTLLDTVNVYMMFQLGVDRLHLTSEKYLASGKVVMEVDCDRASPLTDQFTITVLDERGRTVRRERYSRAEVDESAQMVAPYPTTNPAVEVTVHAEIGIGTTQPSTRPETEPATTHPTTQELTPEQRRVLLEVERRIKAVEAATQPATLR